MPYFRGDTFSKLQFRVIHLNFLGCIPSTSIGIKQSHWYGSALINQFSSLIFPWGFFFSTVCWCTCWELGSRMNGWKFLEGKWFDWIREISGILSFDMCRVSRFVFCANAVRFWEFIMLHFTKLALKSCGNENKQQNPSKSCRPQSQKFWTVAYLDWRCITAWNHRLADVTGQEKEATAGKLRL